MVMSDCTLQEWKEWAGLIKAGKWHTTMLNRFCDLAVENRQRISELEAACESCYDAQQRAQDEVYRLQARLATVERVVREEKREHWTDRKYQRGYVHGWNEALDEVDASLKGENGE